MRKTKEFTRTDLACERIGAGELPKEIFGEICREEEKDGFFIQRLAIRKEEHSTLLGKPTGNYVTVNCGTIRNLSDTDADRLASLLGDEIRTLCAGLCGRVPDRDFSVLIAGLGNEEITPDAIGPQTVRKLNITRHLRGFDEGLYDTVGRCEISGLFPGVLGQTGIETVELVRGAAENVRPDLVVAVDALAARSSARLGTTIQLCDSGIEPGSGIGNERKAINGGTVGVPVISVGVPTVVESATLVWDALEQAGVTEVGRELRTVLENGRSFFVAPKESDVITGRVSSILADAIDRAFTVI